MRRWKAVSFCVRKMLISRVLLQVDHPQQDQACHKAERPVVFSSLPAFSTLGQSSGLPNLAQV